MNIAEIRQKYPQYNDLSDEQLAQGLHKKFYSDMDFGEFSNKIGLNQAQPQTDFMDKVNNGLRQLGGAIEAVDSGARLGFGKKVGGLLNAIGAAPIDTLYNGKSFTENFGNRYNEIVQDAKAMRREFANEHPVADTVLDVGSTITKVPVGILNKFTSKAIQAAAKSPKIVQGLSKWGTRGAVGGAELAAQGAGNADNAADYLTSSQAGEDFATGAALNALLPLGLKGVIAGGGYVGGKLAPKVLGLTTGTGEGMIARAFDAGKRGSKTFLDNIRGKVSPEAVTSEAKNALGEMLTGNSDLYLANMSKALDKNVAISPQPILKKFVDEMNKRTLSGRKFLLTKDTAKVANEIEEKLTQFAEDKALHNTAGMDRLKQALQDIASSAKEGTRGQQFATEMANTVKDTIVTKNPAYKKALDVYAKNAEEVKQIKDAFSLRNNTGVDTMLRKLQSVGRNNVNTNYGYRGRLMDNLDFHGNLQDAIAGQALSSWLPRGMAGSIGAIARGLRPETVFFSPRLVGEGAYSLGKTIGNSASKLRQLSDKINNLNLYSLGNLRKNNKK